MGGTKTAGDMVMRMQLAKGMRIGEAKKYVADKLGVSVMDLSDMYVMMEVRERLGLGLMQPVADTPTGIEAKLNIAKVLGITINSVERFKKRAGLV